MKQKSQIIKTKSLEAKSTKMIHYLIILQKYKEMETNGPILPCKTHINQHSCKESTHGLKWWRTGASHCAVLTTDTLISLLFA